jgi:putative N6-adenine-specific DNA methylase
VENIFIVTAPGLNAVAAQEMARLGLIPPLQKINPAEEPKISKSMIVSEGGIEFSGPLDVLYRLNLHLRTASRILVRIGDFHASAFSELRKKASRLEWERYLQTGQPIAFRVTCRKSRLYHSGAVAERVLGAIGDRLGRQPALVKFDEESGETLPQLILVRLFQDFCTISIDSSGAILHRRGYRLETAKAPLRETLAAGLLMTCGWKTDKTLLDPFCGSGTIPIEAALMARNTPPGCNRRYAFMSWPNFEQNVWDSVLQESQPSNQIEMPSIFASDRDSGAIQAARNNAARAGVADCIEFSCKPISDIEPSGVGWVVTNPPYGLRVSANKDLRNLYAQFGNVLRAKFSGWRIAVLCNDLRLMGQIGLRLDTSQTFDNGGVTVKLGQGVIPGNR